MPAEAGTTDYTYGKNVSFSQASAARSSWGEAYAESLWESITVKSLLEKAYGESPLEWARIASSQRGQQAVKGQRRSPRTIRQSCGMNPP